MILSILIPTLKSRAEVLKTLTDSFEAQIKEYALEKKVTIVPLVNDGSKTIGHYRNELVKICTTPYCWFVDDDDKVCDDALLLIMNAIETEYPDGIGFRGYFQEHHNKIKVPFIVKHGDFYGIQDGVYVRPLNHIAPKKTELYRQIPFPDLRFGEDHAQCMALVESGLIKTSSFIDKEIYFYYPSH